MTESNPLIHLQNLTEPSDGQDKIKPGEVVNMRIQLTEEGSDDKTKAMDIDREFDEDEVEDGESSGEDENDTGGIGESSEFHDCEDVCVEDESDDNESSKGKTESEDSKANSEDENEVEDDNESIEDETESDDSKANSEDEDEEDSNDVVDETTGTIKNRDKGSDTVPCKTAKDYKARIKFLEEQCLKAIQEREKKLRLREEIFLEKEKSLRIREEFLNLKVERFKLESQKELNSGNESVNSSITSNRRRGKRSNNNMSKRKNTLPMHDQEIGEDGDQIEGDQGSADKEPDINKEDDNVE